jgi:pyridoxine 5-phosphate synthase
VSGRDLKLGVNIDHVATLRQLRGTAYPDLVAAAAICEKAGAHGITVHLREDRRHIQDADVYALRASLRVRMNLEMAVAPEIIRVALDVRPDEVCLVPERREELTTEGGLNVAGGMASIGPAVKTLRSAGIVVSLFVEAEEAQLKAAAEAGADYVELHTGRFCDAKPGERAAELTRLQRGARCAYGLGLRVNAGHGISLDTIGPMLRVPHLDTLNIGHSIVCRAVTEGMDRAVREMLERMAAYAGGEA